MVSPNLVGKKTFGAVYTKYFPRLAQFVQKEIRTISAVHIEHQNHVSHLARKTLTGYSEPVLPDFSRYNIPTRGIVYQITTIYTQWPCNVSNGRKVDTLFIKYSNILLCNALQKFTQIAIFGQKIYHLATLLPT
jgi:hypothetical protein